MTSPVTRVPRPPSPTLTPAGAGLSHAGRVRDANEDRVLTDPAGALWAVADGMGGYGHGDVAAEMVIDHLARLPRAASAQALVRALEAANAAIVELARVEGLGQMGATVVAAWIDGARARIAWVGDSRAYRVFAGAPEQLTHDHSVVQELIDRGSITAAEAERHPQAHVVTRAVGAGRRIEIATAEARLDPGDALVLCSDGLTRCVAGAEIAAHVAAEPDPAAACRRLVEAALARGAPDNVSVVVVRMDGARTR